MAEKEIAGKTVQISEDGYLMESSDNRNCKRR
jgi:hypothetical protein